MGDAADAPTCSCLHYPTWRKLADDALSAAGFQDRIFTISQLQAQNQSAFTIIYGLLYAVAAIIALVGAISLFNALAKSVLERLREIGIPRSMGAEATIRAGDAGLGTIKPGGG